MSTPSKVSFTIRRPEPISRADSEASESDTPHKFKVPAIPARIRQQDSSAPGSPLAQSNNATPSPADSSDEEDQELQDELVTGFDKFGVQRLHEKKKKAEGPLVIPALKNKDWRALARKRKSASQFVPDAGRQETGVDGSVGGLGTRDTINSGPQLSGLQVKKPKLTHYDSNGFMEEEDDDASEDAMEQDEDDDAKALRAVLSAASGQTPEDTLTISMTSSSTPVSEQDAFLQDVQVLPESASLTDYDRVPVAQFGAALLRGMGWKEGTAASRRVGKDGKSKGIVEPYLPPARPALLGIGAKERVIEDDGSEKKNKNLRPEKRYVPVVRKETGSNGAKDSSRGDRSKSSRDDCRDRDRDRERDRERRSRDDYKSSSRRASRSRSPQRDRERDRYRESGRDDRRERKEDKDRRYRDDGYDRRRKDYDRPRSRERR